MKVRTRNGAVIEVPETTAKRLARKKRATILEAVRPTHENAAMRVKR